MNHPLSKSELAATFQNLIQGVAVCDIRNLHHRNWLDAFMIPEVTTSEKCSHPVAPKNAASVHSLRQQMRSDLNTMGRRQCLFISMTCSHLRRAIRYTADGTSRSFDECDKEIRQGSYTDGFFTNEAHGDDVPLLLLGSHATNDDEALTCVLESNEEVYHAIMDEVDQDQYLADVTSDDSTVRENAWKHFSWPVIILELHDMCDPEKRQALQLLRLDHIKTEEDRRIELLPGALEHWSRLMDHEREQLTSRFEWFAHCWLRWSPDECRHLRTVFTRPELTEMVTKVTQTRWLADILDLTILGLLCKANCSMFLSYLHYEVCGEVLRFLAPWAPKLNSISHNVALHWPYWTGADELLAIQHCFDSSGLSLQNWLHLFFPTQDDITSFPSLPPVDFELRVHEAVVPGHRHPLRQGRKHRRRHFLSFITDRDYYKVFVKVWKRYGDQTLLLPYFHQGLEVFKQPGAVFLPSKDWLLATLQTDLPRLTCIFRTHWYYLEPADYQRILPSDYQETEVFEERVDGFDVGHHLAMTVIDSITAPCRETMAERQALREAFIHQAPWDRREIDVVHRRHEQERADDLNKYSWSRQVAKERFQRQYLAEVWQTIIRSGLDVRQVQQECGLRLSTIVDIDHDPHAVLQFCRQLLSAPLLVAALNYLLSVDAQLDGIARVLDIEPMRSFRRQPDTAVPVLWDSTAAAFTGLQGLPFFRQAPNVFQQDLYACTRPLIDIFLTSMVVYKATKKLQDFHYWQQAWRDNPKMKYADFCAWRAEVIRFTPAGEILPHGINHSLRHPEELYLERLIMSGLARLGSYWHISPFSDLLPPLPDIPVHLWIQLDEEDLTKSLPHFGHIDLRPSLRPRDSDVNVIAGIRQPPPPILVQRGEMIISHFKSTILSELPYNVDDARGYFEISKNLNTANESPITYVYADKADRLRQISLTGPELV